jgi:hypothetical protein
VICHSPGWQRDYPCVQLATIADLLAGKMPTIPYGVLPIWEAPRVVRTSAWQQGLALTFEDELDRLFETS